MKKLLSSLCLVSVLAVTSCAGTKITADNYLEIYSTQRTEFVDSAQKRTTSQIKNTQSVEGETNEIEYTSEYTEVKNEDETFSASEKLNMSVEGADPTTVDYYYTDNNIYYSSSSSEEKLKFEVPYEDFSYVYENDPFEILAENVVSSEVVEEETNTVVKLVLKQDAYPEVFAKDLDDVSAMTGLPAEMLQSENQDINYSITFDKDGNLVGFEKTLATKITVSFASVLGEGVDTSEMPDQVIERTVVETVALDKSDAVTITLPEDLDTYTAQ